MKRLTVMALLLVAVAAHAQTAVVPNTLNGGFSVEDYKTGQSMHFSPNPHGGYNVNRFDPYRQEQQFLNDYWAPRPGDSASDVRYKSRMRSLMW